MTKDGLIANLIAAGYLKTPSIIKAFQTVDRADFVLPEYRPQAYVDHPLPIGFGQTISQPLTVAMMLEWLAPKKGQKILDIGCGSGWTTALLASIVGKKGKVIGIERIPQLAEFAKNNLAKYSLLYYGTVIQCADGSKGYAREAPFDRILASASAGEIPQAWKEQLKIGGNAKRSNGHAQRGGRLVAPVKDAVVVIEKLSAEKYQQAEHWGFAFVPLVIIPEDGLLGKSQKTVL